MTNVSAKDLAGRVLNELKRRGKFSGPDSRGNYRALCPFHTDRNHPNLGFHPIKGFICFACGERGGVVKLANKLGIEPQKRRKTVKINTEAEAMDYLMTSRCLTQDVIRQFGITANIDKQAWMYPVDGGYRFKSFNSGTKRQKYWHTKGVPNQLYGLGNIAQGTEKICIANGEPVVWQLWQVGIPSVCGLYGEGKLPADAISKLQNMGVSQVMLYPDLDDAGLQAAKDLYFNLHNTFDVTIYTLPPELGLHGDLGDLFVQCAGDREKFTSILQSLPKFNAESWESASIETKIESVRKEKELASFEKKKIIAEIVIDDLRSRGFFINAVGEYYWFWNERKRVLPLGSTYFLSLIENWYGINASEVEYKYLAESLRTAAELTGKQTEVFKFARYQSGKLYISKFSGQMYRLDGNQITVLPNGEDGVFFLDDPDWESFEYRPNTAENYLKSLLVDPINFADDPVIALSPDEQRFVYLQWIYGLFFESVLPTKPILVLLGEKGSGKTSTLQWLLLTLFGSKAKVQSLIRNKEDAFISTVTTNYLACFDNADGRVTWLNDHLATLATGARYTFRKLYTTNTSVSYTPHVFLALTSRSPHFRRDDVADRLLLLRVSRIPNFKSEWELQSERLNLRNEIWSELLDDLNTIVETLKSSSNPDHTRFRMADWASLTYQIAESLAKGDRWLKILGRMESEKSRFILEEDPLYVSLDIWMNNSQNIGREVDSKTLFRELSTICKAQNLSWNYKNARSLAQRITNIESNLSDFFRIATRVESSGRRKVYRFERLESVNHSRSDSPIH